jgi:hypothetical protein
LGDGSEKLLQIGRAARRVAHGCVVFDLAFDTFNVVEAYHQHKNWMKEAFVEYGETILGTVAGVAVVTGLSFFLGGWCLVIATSLPISCSK